MRKFIIEDEPHAEWQEGEFSSFDQALDELRRRAAVPWNQAPNTAPCTGWEKCGRSYEIIEYETSVDPWAEIARTPALKISAEGVNWLIHA